MNLLMKWTLLFAAMMLVVNSNRAAWTIGAKGRVNGPAIHTTYFLTPNNGLFPVRAKAYTGTFVNGICQYSVLSDLGYEGLKTGDRIDIDAFALKSIFGGGFGCLTIYYFYKQQVIETIQLAWDGFNYIASFPPVSQVTIQ